MPHARIAEQQERWLKNYCRTKNAGAEFLLPWVIDTFFRAIADIKTAFTGPELKAVIAAHRNLRLLPDHARLSYLLLHIGNLCETDGLSTRYGISRSSLEAKLRRLDDTQTTALMVWASAFWVDHGDVAEDMDEYIKIC